MKKKFVKSTKNTGWSLSRKAPKGYRIYHVGLYRRNTKKPEVVYYFEKKGNKKI